MKSLRSPFSSVPFDGEKCGYFRSRTIDWRQAAHPFNQRVIPLLILCTLAGLGGQPIGTFRGAVTDGRRFFGKGSDGSEGARRQKPGLTPRVPPLARIFPDTEKGGLAR